MAAAAVLFNDGAIC